MAMYKVGTVMVEEGTKLLPRRPVVNHSGGYSQLLERGIRFLRPAQIKVFAEEFATF
jgi:hypothetical protein